jgi:hypothetical protein
MLTLNPLIGHDYSGECFKVLNWYVGGNGVEVELKIERVSVGIWF